MHRYFTLSSLALAIGFAASSAAWARLPVQRLAGSGDAAPGLSGLTISDVSPFNFALGNNNSFGFKATLSGGGVTTANDEAFFSGSYGSPGLAIREGNDVPGLAGSTIGILGNVAMNKSGDLAMEGSNAAFNWGVEYVRNSGTWMLAAMRTQSAPDTTRTYNGFFTPVMLNEAGEIGFRCTLMPTVNFGTGAVFTGSANNLHLFGAEGQQIPDQPAGASYGAMTLYPGYSNAGVAIQGWVSTKGQAVFAGKPGSVKTVAAATEQANGLAAGVKHQFFGDPSINNNGLVAYTTSLTGGPAGAPTGAVYAGTINNPQPVMTTLDQPPGLPADLDFGGFTDALIADDGRVAFIGQLVGNGVTFDTRNALYFGTPSDVRLIARAGAQAPGVPDGWLFDAAFGYSDGEIAYNHAGQIAFHGAAGSMSDGADGIWATLPDGTLVDVVMRGDTLNVQGVDREVEFVNIVANQEQGTGSGFMDDGRLALSIQFTDNTSGIFVTSVVPEPAACVLLLPALAFIRQRRRVRMTCR